MKRDWFVLLILAISVVIVYRLAFFNFFAQDDFILISHFSQNDLAGDLKNVFGEPTVTHWRPLHNLYFFIAGNLFGKNYFGYHLLTFLIHLASSFLIYKVTGKLFANFLVAFAAAFIYAVHPVHFVSLFWISGGATAIGFFFLIGAFYSLLLQKKWLALILYGLSLLASEAMLAGLPLLASLSFLLKWQGSKRKFLLVLTGISVIFLLIKLPFLTSQTTFAVYKVELSPKILVTVKYYLLRVLGFAESSGDEIASAILIIWLLVISLLLFKRRQLRKTLNKIGFYAIAIFLGFFPFVLIPSHLSPHYMNISTWGMVTIASLAFLKQKPVVTFILLLVFFIVSLNNAWLTFDNNWVVKRSNLARQLIESIEKTNPPAGSSLVFTDTSSFSSFDAYVALGGGRAIDFWFKGGNYQYCFSEFATCRP